MVFCAPLLCFCILCATFVPTIPFETMSTMRAIHTYLKVSAFLCFLLFLCQCKKSTTPGNAPADALFTLLDPAKTGVDFQNAITEGLNTNVLMYEYFYNGGGVAVGDVNNDGLDDLYFTSNMQSNRLYLNKGNMVFEDITIGSGVTGRDGPICSRSCCMCTIPHSAV